MIDVCRARAIRRFLAHDAPAHGCEQTAARDARCDAGRAS
jgi:hypothetical protein